MLIEVWLRLEIGYESYAYLMASSIFESRRVLVTSLNNSRHSSLVGASMPMLP